MDPKPSFFRCSDCLALRFDCGECVHCGGFCWPDEFAPFARAAREPARVAAPEPLARQQLVEAA